MPIRGRKRNLGASALQNGRGKKRKTHGASSAANEASSSPPGNGNVSSPQQPLSSPQQPLTRSQQPFTSLQPPITSPTTPGSAANAGCGVGANVFELDPGASQASASNQPNEYTYNEIPSDEIRILIVHRGGPTSELYCTLKNRHLRPLDTHGRPIIEKDGDGVELEPYEALSYSWQDQTPQYPIFIMDAGTNSGYRLHSITENLRDALITLRHPSKERHFWVDAVCMNQVDLVEKSKQLPLMARIYSEASNVCVWLGLEREKKNTKEAFDLMWKIRRLVDFEDLVEVKTDCKDWDAFIALMTRNWFNRRWVVQEITLARKATLHCGAREIPWKSFAEAVGLLEVMIDRVKEKFAKSGRDPDKFGDIREFSASRLVRVTNSMVAKNDLGQVVQKESSLEELVSALTPFEAKSPHDIIYAVLSLASDVAGSTVTGQNEGNIEWTADKVPQEMLEGQTLPREKVFDILKRAFRHLKVDKFPVHYQKEFYEVCEDFLKFSTSQSNSLDMICRPWAPPIPPRSSQAPLPSWIRTLTDAPFGRNQNGHWDRKNANALVGMPGQSPYKASGSYRRPWKFDKKLGAPLLTVHGFQLEVIQELEETAQAGVIPYSWLKYGNLEGKQFRPHEDSTETPSNVTESFWRTMVANKGPDGEAPPPHYAFLCEKTFTTVVEHGGDVMLGQIHDRSDYTLQKSYIRRVQSVVWGRKLTKTARFLALVPKGTKDGDIIAILFGVSVPVVLRKLNSQNTIDASDEQFQFIGECYAHGAMAGEAFDIINNLRNEQFQQKAGAVAWNCGNREFRLR